MIKFYMTFVQVEVRNPLCAAWTNDQIKQCLAAKIHTYGNYGHVQVIQPKEPVVHNDALPYEATSSHSDDATETIEARVIRKLEQFLSLTSSLAQNITILRVRSNGGQSGYALTPPDEAVNVKRNKEEANTDVHPCSDQVMGK